MNIYNIYIRARDKRENKKKNIYGRAQVVLSFRRGGKATVPIEVEEDIKKKKKKSDYEWTVV